MNDFDWGFMMGIAMGDDCNSSYQQIDQLKASGTLLPPNAFIPQEIERKTNDIVDNWFERHPEIQRESGEFEDRYLKIVHSKRLLLRLLQVNRITEDEYFTLLRAMFSF